jgi:hypothetical protein
MSTPFGASLRANMGDESGLLSGAIGAGAGVDTAATQQPPTLPGEPMPSYGGDGDSHAAFNDWISRNDPSLVALHLGSKLGPQAFRELSAAANKGSGAWNAALFQALSDPKNRKLLAEPSE